MVPSSLWCEELQLGISECGQRLERKYRQSEETTGTIRPLPEGEPLKARSAHPHSAPLTCCGLLWLLLTLSQQLWILSCEL
jgi:hypothetical protein